ncbi:LytTR family DNA-binding domain-containing protein [Hyphococcus sp.]|uniref:LytTR family DNA-binding domain-containing protein n=1 Tax=Hyphococcus sp. TaxID=2038636 RepID=UPI0035C6B8BC
MSAHVVKRRPQGGQGRWIAAVATLAIILAFSDAYDTDDLTVAHRLTLFTMICGLLIGQAWLLDEWFRRIFSNSAAGRMLAGGITVALTLVLMTLEVHALKYTPLLPKAPDPLFEFALFLSPFVISLAALVVFVKSPAARAVAELEPLEIGYERMLELSAHPVIAGLLPPPAPEAIAEWPVEPVMTVVSQDHYIEITTASGRSLIRGRMKDALARLSGEDGIRPHRSWWVRASEVCAVVRRGRDRMLMLRDGVEAPVARARWKRVRLELLEAGVDC